MDIGASPTTRKPKRGNCAAVDAPSDGKRVGGQKEAWEIGCRRRGMR
jgi:hypothetical protein